MRFRNIILFLGFPPSASLASSFPSSPSLVFLRAPSKAFFSLLQLPPVHMQWTPVFSVSPAQTRSLNLLTLISSYLLSIFSSMSYSHLRLNMSKHCVHEFPFHLQSRHISSLLGLLPPFSTCYHIKNLDFALYFCWSMLPHQHVLSSCTSPPCRSFSALFMPPSSPSWTTDWSSWLQCCTYQSNNYTVIENSESPGSLVEFRKPSWSVPSHPSLITPS